jgi:hypothetical protein
MSSHQQPFNAYDPKAVEIIQAVLDGKTTPEEGASRLGSYWSPVESLRADDLPFLVQTREDSLCELDRAVIELCNQNRFDEARRLAELNWILAKRFDDEELMVQCASTLAQMLMGDPAAAGERLALLEFAVPRVVESNRDPYIKAIMLAHLADARFAEAMADARLHRATIGACQQALSIDASLEDFWLGHLNFIAGTEYHNLGEGAEHYQSSVNYLSAALKYFRSDKYPDKYASTLNNLGNSYLDLGQMTRDCSFLQESLACYEKALPFRADEHLRRRTLQNIERAQEILEGLDRTGTAAPSQPVKAVEAVTDQEQQTSRVKELIHTSDDAVYASLENKDRSELFLKRAADKLIEAMKTVGRDGEASLRAEVSHRLATLFLESTEDDALWTGLCFASTTQRLTREKWKAVNQARVASQRGMMLMKIGYPNLLHYLLPAAALLRDSIPMLQQSGHPGEAEWPSMYLTITDHQLAACGVDESQQRVFASHAQEEVQRLEAEALRPPPDELHKIYRAYLHLVTEAAALRFNALLGELGFEAERVLLDGYIDEYNRAQGLIEVAAQHRDIGDLASALSLAEKATGYAQEARYSAPSIWCQLAEFYSLLPLREEAVRCIEKAQDSMALAVKEDDAVLPDDKSGRWIPEFSMDVYQEEIDRIKDIVIDTPSTPHFDPTRTAQLLAPEDELMHLQLAQTIRRGLARANLS